MRCRPIPLRHGWHELQLLHSMSCRKISLVHRFLVLLKLREWTIRPLWIKLGHIWGNTVQ
jgi:hypothetical protein